jgi:sugar lactone lactonase YvrE
MKKTYPLRASLLALVLALAASPFARAQADLATGRAALALQTPAGLETAHQAFKTGLQTTPDDAALNFFYAATLLTREAHTAEFKQQFTSLNATITNPSIYALEYSFPLGFAGIIEPPASANTGTHLAYLNSKAVLIDQALASLDKITDGNFTVTLTSAETSLLDTKVDFADVCLLRAGLRLAKAGLHLANSYNLSGEYRKLYDLYAAGNLTPQAVLAAFPQLFNLSATPSQRSDARAQIQLAHAEWNKALEAIKTKRPASEGSVLGPIGYSDATPFLFAFDSIASAEEVDVLFDTLVTSLSSQVTVPAVATEDFALEGCKINLSNLVTSPSSPRSLAPTRFDRGFFRPSTWPDATLGGVFPEATQDNANDAGNFLFVLQPTIYEPYQFWLLAGTPDEPGYFEEGEVRFRDINGIAVDANGNIYVADQGNHVIRKISIDNKVTTIAGQKWSDWSERQALQQQYEGYPSYYPAILDWNWTGSLGQIAVDGNGTVYFVNGRVISKVTAGGILSNLAGSLTWSYQDARDGLGSDAVFANLTAIATDKNGSIYACDAHAIRKITPTGQVTTLAGKLGWDDSEGYVDGPGSAARFNDPTGVAVDDAGVVFVMDSDNLVIRKIQPNGTTSTFVGDAKNGNYFDAKGTKARLSQPDDLAIDSSGNLYFTDGAAIRKVKPDGTVTTLAGKLSPEHGAFRLRGQMGIQEAAGKAAVFGEDDVKGLAVDRRGTLYAAFENSIYEAESIAAPPSGAPFPTPTPLSTPSTKPTPTPTPGSPGPLLSDIDLTPSSSTIDVSNGPVDVVLSVKTSAELFNLGLDFTNTSATFRFFTEFHG